jgi:hypothetical protein
MRITLTLVVVFGLSAVVAAQSSMPASREFTPRPSIGLPLPPIGLPLPPIGLPLAPSGLARPLISSPPAIDMHRGHMNGRPALDIARQHRRFGQDGAMRSGGAVIFFVPTYGWPYPEASGFPGKPAVREEPVPRTGRLRLDLQPGVSPQIYVDGYYVGTLYDFNGELTLDAGPHKLELRADGYELLELDVQISAGRSITYRGAMKDVEAMPTPVAQVPASPDLPPPAPATIYMIPGCYLGNLPPKDAKLPAGCDETRAITLNPR